jgi:hypothetical protein
MGVTNQPNSVVQSNRSVVETGYFQTTLDILMMEMRMMRVGSVRSMEEKSMIIVVVEAVTGAVRPDRRRRFFALCARIAAACS